VFESESELQYATLRKESPVCSTGPLGEVGWGGMDWIHLAQDRDQWRALVHTVMNLRVP
jgi:hypothetical protein